MIYKVTSRVFESQKSKASYSLCRPFDTCTARRSLINNSHALSYSLVYCERDKKISTNVLKDTMRQKKVSVPKISQGVRIYITHACQLPLSIPSHHTPVLSIAHPRHKAQGKKKKRRAHSLRFVLYLSSLLASPLVTLLPSALSSQSLPSAINSRCPIFSSFLSNTRNL